MQITKVTKTFRDPLPPPSSARQSGLSLGKDLGGQTAALTPSLATSDLSDCLATPSDGWSW